MKKNLQKHCLLTSPYMYCTLYSTYMRNAEMLKKANKRSTMKEDDCALLVYVLINLQWALKGVRFYFWSTKKIMLDILKFSTQKTLNCHDCQIRMKYVVTSVTC